MQHRPFEIPLVKKKRSPAHSAIWYIVGSVSVKSSVFGGMGLLWMEVVQDFFDKTGRKLADTRGPIMTALALLMHILWVNIKEKKKKKHPTCSDSQRHFATRKIKVECGKAWGLCALGRERVRWAHIYSKARTAWGFDWPLQHWGRRPDPKPPLLNSYSYPLCQQSPPQTPLLSLSCRKTQPDTFI